jgi:hypothetical protein
MKLPALSEAGRKRANSGLGAARAGRYQQRQVAGVHCKPGPSYQRQGETLAAGTAFGTWYSSLHKDPVGSSGFHASIALELCSVMTTMSQLTGVDLVNRHCARCFIAGTAYLQLRCDLHWRGICHDTTEKGSAQTWRFCSWVHRSLAASSSLRPAGV